jgi:hypothetical protein
MSSSSVWVQLYYEGKNDPKGRPVEIEPIPKNINALAKEVKKERAVALSHCDAADLDVYPPETKPPFSQDNAVGPGDDVPPGTTSKNPLIVVAPQLQPGGEYTLGPPQQVRGKTNKLLFILFIFYDGFLTFAPSMLCM